MRVVALFFVLFFNNYLYSQIVQEVNVNQTKNFYKKLYQSILQSDTVYISSFLPDSFLVGEAYSEAYFCPKGKVLSWLISKKSQLPSFDKVNFKEYSLDENQKMLIFSYQNNLLFTLVIDNKKTTAISLGIGRYLLIP